MMNLSRKLQHQNTLSSKQRRNSHLMTSLVFLLLVSLGLYGVPLGLINHDVEFSSSSFSYSSSSMSLSALGLVSSPQQQQKEKKRKKKKHTIPATFHPWGSVTLMNHNHTRVHIKYKMHTKKLQQLTTKSTTSQRQPYLIVGLLSKASTMDQRTMVRETYARQLYDDKQHDGLQDVHLIFLVAGRFTPALSQEFEQYQDLLYVRHRETYREVTVKTMAFFHAMTNTMTRTINKATTSKNNNSQQQQQQQQPTISFQYLLKSDDDTYLHLSQIKEWLKGRQRLEQMERNDYNQTMLFQPLHYGGRCFKGMEIIRNPESKWYVSPFIIPSQETHYRPYASGAGYFVSRTTAACVAANAPKRPYIASEDANTGWIYHEYCQQQLQQQIQQQQQQQQLQTFSSSSCLHVPYLINHVIPIEQDPTARNSLQDANVVMQHYMKAPLMEAYHARINLLRRIKNHENHNILERLPHMVSGRVALVHGMLWQPRQSSSEKESTKKDKGNIILQHDKALFHIRYLLNSRQIDDWKETWRSKNITRHLPAAQLLNSGRNRDSADGSSLLLVMAIASQPFRVEQRMAIRKAWGRHSQIRQHFVILYFIISSPFLTPALRNEWDEFGDIFWVEQQQPFRLMATPTTPQESVDAVMQNMASMAFVQACHDSLPLQRGGELPPLLLLRIDDNVDVDTLPRFFTSTNGLPRQSSYMGTCGEKQRIEREDLFDAYYLPKQLLSDHREFYPPFAVSNEYLLDSKGLRCMASQLQKRTPLLPMENANIGYLMERCGEKCATFEPLSKVTERHTSQIMNGSDVEQESSIDIHEVDNQKSPQHVNQLSHTTGNLTLAVAIRKAIERKAEFDKVQISYQFHKERLADCNKRDRVTLTDAISSKLAVAVVSVKYGFMERHVIRQTWGREVKNLFFLVATDEWSTRLELESSHYHDIFLVNTRSLANKLGQHKDGFRYDSILFLSFVHAITTRKFPYFEYVLRTSDITYVNASRLEALLPPVASSSFDYTSSSCQQGNPILRPESSTHNLPKVVLPSNGADDDSASNGVFYILSNKAIRCLAKSIEANSNEPLLSQEKLNIEHKLGLSGERDGECLISCTEHKEYDSLSMHGVGPYKMRSLYAESQIH